ncbi:conserved uncharacterized protein, exonuclease-related [Desulfosarcina variabilis str. Montpellier]|uniref:PD-(D/E)XK nuclease-like domain-containing protein n=1 Tax=Desulfosarcina variabilis TaxID=2300 RepID=UPI003AFA01EF
MEPGIYPSLSNEEYHGNHTSYSKSSLADFAVYPYKLIFKRENPPDRSKFALGTATHTAILEPDKWNSEITVIPEEVLGKNGSKNTNAYRAWEAKQPINKTIITPAERELVLGMRESVLEKPDHSQARDLLTGGHPEVSCFWNELFKNEATNKDTGYRYMANHQYDAPDGCHSITMKCRPDYIPADRVMVDLKTTKTPIDKDSFDRHAEKLKYHWSAALTLRGMHIVTGKHHPTYIFVVVEVEPPHEVAVFQATQEFIALGKKESMRAMQYLAWCDKNNFWPGAPNLIQQVGLKPWGYKKLNQEEN